jgi:hypothetical protein
MRTSKLQAGATRRAPGARAVAFASVLTVFCASTVTVWSEEEPSDEELALYDEAYAFFLNGALPMPSPGISFRHHGFKVEEFYASLTWGRALDGASQVLAYVVEPVGEAASSQMMSAVEVKGMPTLRDLVCAVKLQESRVSSAQCPAIREILDSLRPEWGAVKIPQPRDPQADIPVIADGQTAEVSIEEAPYRSTLMTERDEKSLLFQWVLRSSTALRECLATVSAQDPRAPVRKPRQGCSH